MLIFGDVVRLRVQRRADELDDHSSEMKGTGDHLAQLEEARIRKTEILVEIVGKVSRDAGRERGIVVDRSYVLEDESEDLKRQTLEFGDKCLTTRELAEWTRATRLSSPARGRCRGQPPT